MLGQTPEWDVREWPDTGCQGPRHGSRDNGCWFLADLLQRVATRIIDVENNFAKDEALSRFMFIWRKETVMAQPRGGCTVG
jgi:hypothetical protein